MGYEHKEYIEMFLSIHDKDEQKELDEVYRKAEAFDRIAEEVNSAGETMYNKESLVRYAVDNAFWNIDGIIVDYESGETE